MVSSEMVVVHEATPALVPADHGVVLGHETAPGHELVHRAHLCHFGSVRGYLVGREVHGPGAGGRVLGYVLHEGVQKGRARVGVRLLAYGVLVGRRVGLPAAVERVLERRLGCYRRGRGFSAVVAVVTAGDLGYHGVVVGRRRAVSGRFNKNLRQRSVYF